MERFFGRVAFLEGKVEAQSEMINDIRETGARLERRFDQLEQRLEQRFSAIDQRFALVDARFVAIDGRLDRMSAQLSNLMIAALVAAAGGLLGMITALLR